MFGKGRTLSAGLFEDPHWHHDRRRGGAEDSRRLGLLQRGDGGAVLRRVVGVRTVVAGRSRRVQGLGWKKGRRFLAPGYVKTLTCIRNVVQ